MPAVHDQKRVGAIPPPCAVTNNGANRYGVCTFRLEDAIKRTLPVRQRRSFTTISDPGSSSHTSLNSSAVFPRFKASLHHAVLQLDFREVLARRRGSD